MKSAKIFTFLLVALFTCSSTQLGYAHSTNETSFQQKKKVTAKKKSKVTKKSGCYYNNHKLYVGPRGGCYYYSGNSKQYVDRGYCSGCN